MTRRTIAPGILMFTVLAIAAVSATDASTGTSKEHWNSSSCEIPDVLTRSRPGKGDVATEVEVGIFVFDLFGVNERAESFEIDFAVIQKWRDPRLSKRERGTSLQNCRIHIEDIWDPGVEPLNPRELDRERGGDVFVGDAGDVTYTAFYEGTMSSPFNLRRFPFDNQELPIRLTTFRYQASEVKLFPNEQWTGRLESASLAGWKILGADNVAEVPAVKSVVGAHSRVDHVISVQRNASFYVWKFAIPLCFIVLMSASVYWLNPETFGQQLQISTGSVFALVAYLVSLGNNLPQIEYLTNLDKLVFGSTTLVFVSLGEVIVTSRLVNRNKGALARRIDWHARWIFVLLFGTLVSVTMILV